MRKLLSFIFLILLTFWGVSQAQAASVCDSTSGNIVTNCGFEAGNFAGWTLSGDLQGPPPAPLGPGFGNNYYGVDDSNPNSGNYEAYFGVQSENQQTGSGNKYGPPITLSQTVAALPSQYYEVSFYLDNNGCSVSDGDCPGYYNYFDAYFNGVLLTKQFNIPYSGAYDEYVFVVPTSGGMNPYNPGVLQFDFTNDSDVYYFDDVTVTSLGATPEPASLLLVTPVLGGLWLLRRRRKA